MKILSKIIVIITIFGVAASFGQNSRTAVDKELKNLQNQIKTLKAENERLQKSATSTLQKVEAQTQEIEDLKSKNLQTIKEIEKKTDSLENKISNSNATTTEKIADFNSSLSRNTILGILAVGFASLLSIGLFIWIRRKNTVQNLEITDQIKKTQQTLQEESVRLDTKLAEIFSQQMSLIGDNRQKDSEVDHSLVLKIANEINRMQMNIKFMDAEVRGLKQLNRALNNMIDNLRNKDYEIVDLLGKPYDEGMNLVATMEIDEKLEAGQEIIRRIIMPQVNYKGATIQAAEAVVGYGE